MQFIIPAVMGAINSSPQLSLLESTDSKARFIDKPSEEAENFLETLGVKAQKSL
jgi:hypothetical protein